VLHNEPVEHGSTYKCLGHNIHADLIPDVLIRLSELGHAEIRMFSWAREPKTRIKVQP
jgi:hypothetical protein